MKYLLIVGIFLVAGCTSVPVSKSSIPTEAIYLVQRNGQLSQEDLKAHPEVIVTSSFKEFKTLADSKVALWIDINAVELVDLGWLGESPQRFYPVVLVGNGDASCSFFEAMQYFAFSVPCCLDCSSTSPGFSVNMLTSESGGTMHGYKQIPTVQGILEITNPLLADAQ